MSTPERLAADLARVGIEQAEAAARSDWDAVGRHDQVRRALLDALRVSKVEDSPPVRESLAAAHAASLAVDQAFRAARPALNAEARRAKLGATAGKAYGLAAADDGLRS